MGLNARVDPHGPREVVCSGYTVLVTRPDGSLSGEGREGLFDFDTRILSRHHLTLNGTQPRRAGGGVGAADHWRAVVHVPRPGGTSAGPVLPQDMLELEIERRVGCGMEERLTLFNHSMASADVELCIELDADFADVMQIGSDGRPSAIALPSWDASRRALHFDFRAERDEHAVARGLRVRVLEPGDGLAFDGRMLRARLNLEPRGVWRARLSYASLVDGVWRDPVDDSAAELRRRAALRAEWAASRATVASSERLVHGAFERAAEDLIALRNWEYDGPDGWVPNAGVPTYTGLFGRDTLTAAWQSAMLGPDMMRGALARLASTQATEDSAWRDAEPGKLLHEMRRGPLSELDLVPQRAYYGEQTAQSMFVIVLSEYWHWTGDRAMLERYRDTALRIFEWAERYGDRDGDGLLEYTRRSARGLKNHAWKDSDEAIRYPDGTIVPDPIATIEEQAYHFVALQRMAAILLVLGDDAGADRFLEKARSLRDVINDRFWMDDLQFYAMGLDPDKRPIRSIASNAGHALAAGLVPPERARRVAERLLAPDMFSGWGVRTLSTRHPSYNPFAYHLGTVWPVENATFALAFKRYGLDDEAERIVTGMLDAAARFAELRLPEALGGHARDEVGMPTYYPLANSPQAWSSSAVVQLIQAQLGIYPFAPARMLALVRPRLPASIPELTVRRVRVGDATVSLRFRRRDDGSASDTVLERAGTVRVVSAPPPFDVTSDRETLRDHAERWALRRAPGHIARALRIALGLEGVA